MSKKLFIIISVILTIAVGVGAYFYFFRSTPSTNQNTDGSLSGDNPFGTAGTSTYTPDENRIENSDGSVTVPVIALTHIYPDPVSGATSYKLSKDGTTYARFMDRATGHVYTFDFSTGLLNKTTDTTIPKIYETTWTTTGNNAVLRYLADDSSTIRTYQAKLVLPAAASSTITGTLQGTFLPDNISSLAISPSNKKVAYVARGTAGAQVVSANIDGTKPTTLYSSALFHWNLAWPNDNTLTLTSSPSAQTPGYLYFLSTAGSLRRVVGGVAGLTATVDPSANLIAYSNNILTLSVLNLKTNTTTIAPVSTLAEKCVWSIKEKGVMYCAVPQTVSSQALPDAWYQGTVSFTDSIYKINTATNIATIVADLPGTFKQSLDVIQPVLSPNEDLLIFTNKKDLSLWSIRIAE